MWPLLSASFETTARKESDWYQNNEMLLVIKTQKADQRDEVQRPI